MEIFFSMVEPVNIKHYLCSTNLPFHNLQLRANPIILNHEYYTDLFENDFLLLIPECFAVISVFIILLYGVIFSQSNVGKRFDIDDEYCFSPIKEKKEFQGIVFQANPILGVNSSWIAVLMIVFTILLFSNNPVCNASVLSSCFLLDDFGLFLKILLFLATLFSIIISIDYLEQEKLNNFELQTIILISSIMMLFLISSVDFISIYLAIECQSLCFYVMAGMKRENEASCEAGLKYFLLGAFSSGILLFGFALQYGFTGTTNFYELSKVLLSYSSPSLFGDQSLLGGASIDPAFFSPLAEEALSQSNGAGYQGLSSNQIRGAELGMIFILVGFLFKASAVPFHMWAPDVYEGAPTSVTAFFAIVPKISIVAICLRFCYIASSIFLVSWQKILILSSILSMLLGSFAALAQNKIKRLLAWSSIGHVGFLLTALASGSIEASQALVFYLVIYIVMTIALFQIILLPLRREKITRLHNSQSLEGAEMARSITQVERMAESITANGNGFAGLSTTASPVGVGVYPVSQGFRLDREKENHESHAIKLTSDLSFLSQTYPVIAMTVMITMFSIAGIPPLAGFWSKAFLLFAVMSAKQFTLAIMIIATSVITCFYYIRIIKIMYFQSSLPKWKTALKERTQTSGFTFLRISKESCIVWGIAVAILVFFSLFAGVLFKATHLLSLSLS